MNLTLVDIFSAPVKLPRCTTWVAEHSGQFLISDQHHLARIFPDGRTEVIWKAADEEQAFAMKGYCDERLPDNIYRQLARQGIEGFQLLDKAEYKKIDKPNGSTSLIEQAKSYGLFDRGLPVRAHGKILSFGKKSVQLHKLGDNALTAFAKVNTKGKVALHATLHPAQDLIIYGTNAGELYGQYFDGSKFGKSVKIDQLPNTCYQVSFNAEGSRLFVCGVGFLRIYEFNKNEYIQLLSLATACRSFVLTENYLILNKGIQGIELLDVADAPQRVGSMDAPFAIDKMEYLHTSQTILITSNSSQDFGLIRYDYK